MSPYPPPGPRLALPQEHAQRAVHAGHRAAGGRPRAGVLHPRRLHRPGGPAGKEGRRGARGGGGSEPSTCLGVCSLELKCTALLVSPFGTWRIHAARAEESAAPPRYAGGGRADLRGGRCGGLRRRQPAVQPAEVSKQWIFALRLGHSPCWLAPWQPAGSSETWEIGPRGEAPRPANMFH